MNSKDTWVAGSARRREPTTWLRVWAWIMGTLAFFAPWALLGISPKPESMAQPASPPAPTQPPTAARPVVHRVVRTIIVTKAPPTHSAPSVQYVGSGGGSYAPAPAPAPAPVTGTGGS